MRNGNTSHRPCHEFATKLPLLQSGDREGTHRRVETDHVRMDFAMSVEQFKPLLQMLADHRRSQTTDTSLAQLTSNTLPYVVVKIVVLTNCVSYVTEHLVLRDRDRENVSY